MSKLAILPLTRFVHRIPPIPVWPHVRLTQRSTTTSPPTSDNPDPELSELDVVASRGDVAGAIQMLTRELKVKSNVPRVWWNTALKACAIAGDVLEAGRIYEDMRANDVQPNGRTFGKIIESCAKSGQNHEARRWLDVAKASGLKLSLVHYTAAMDAASKNGNVAIAERFLAEMEQAALTPNSVTYTSLISAAARAGDMSSAQRFWSRMEKNQIEPSYITYSAVLNACARAGDVAMLVGKFEAMRKQGIETNEIVWTTMVDGFARAGKMADAEVWLGGMLRSGFAPDIRTFGAVINGYAQLRSSSTAWQRALSVFEIMEHEHHLTPTVVQYSQLLNCYLHADPPQVTRAEILFERMAKLSVHNTVSMRIACRIFGRAWTWLLCEKFDVDFQMAVKYGSQSELSMQKRQLNRNHRLDVAAARGREHLR